MRTFVEWRKMSSSASAFGRLQIAGLSDFQPFDWPLLGKAVIGLLRRMDIF
jgi:hypothetical protein